MKSSKEALAARGFVEEGSVSSDGWDEESLASALRSSVAVERSTAAIAIGKGGLSLCIPMLIDALSIEKKLYTKLAISDALVLLGEPAVLPLVGILGKVGSNQHNVLPVKPFLKKSFPLPRDIGARILVRMGPVVLPLLHGEIPSMERDSILESIDVMGHISFYSDDTSSLSILLELFHVLQGNTDSKKA